ncbi:MAG: hypothetical protein EOO92_18190, partial [Pedobacter sp.]
IVLVFAIEEKTNLTDKFLHTRSAETSIHFKNTTSYNVAAITFHQTKVNTAIPHFDDSDYSIIMDNVRSVVYANSDPISSVSNWAEGYVENQHADGSWNFTYTGTGVAYTHLEYIRKMAMAYTRPGTRSFNKPALYNAIVKGLEYWYTVNPTHWNWYYNQINYPCRIAEILVLMRYGLLKLPADLESKMFFLLENKGGDPSGQEGSNRTQLARHWIYRGCLKKDRATLDKGIELTFNPLELTTGFGIQHDYSFKAHGPQLYIGAYGREFVEDIAETLVLCEGSSYILSSERLDIYSNFLRSSYLRVIRGQFYLYNILGRSIAFKNRLSQAEFPRFLRIIKEKDPANANIYDAAIARINLTQPPSYQLENTQTHFYSSDYTLHSKPTYTFDVRAVSTRTYRSENGNGESLLGYFLADGGTAITVSGNEYYNIFPSWNWAMIPGTTTRNGTMVRPAAWGTYGSTNFVGGVSDTTRGVSVYDMNSNNTQAKKAWFFFDDEIVCLGAGVSATGTEQVNTTLNQSLLQGDVTTFTNAGTLTVNQGNATDQRFNDLKWVLHANIGYVIPNGGNVGLTALPRIGRWSNITTNESTADVSNNVFTLWLKHDAAPNNSSYAYIVVPNKNTAVQMNDYVSKKDISILANTKQVQAVRHKQLNLHGFIFHSANQTYSNDTISVNADKACLVMVQPISNGKLRLHVSDPTKTQIAITLKVKWMGESAAREITIRLP